MRRHHQHEHGALALDELGEATGVEWGLHDARRRQAHRRELRADHAGERRQRHGVQERAALLDRRDRMVGGVVVGRRDALREAGRARRVEDVGQVVAADVDSKGRVVAVDEIGVRQHIATGRSPAARATRGVWSPAVTTAVAPLSAQDVLDLAARVARVDEHRHRARSEHGDVRDLQRARGVVGHEQRHPVALACACAAQAPRHRVGPPVPLGVRHLGDAVDPHRHPVAETLGPVVHLVAHEHDPINTLPPMQMTAAPILIGSLFDFPQADEGASFLDAVRLGPRRRGCHRPPRPPGRVRASPGTRAPARHRPRRRERLRRPRGAGRAGHPRTVDQRQRAHRARPRRRRRAAVHQLHGRRAHAERVHVPLPGRLARGGARRARPASRRPGPAHGGGDPRPLARRPALRGVLRAGARPGRPRGDRARAAIAPLAEDASALVSRLRAAEPDALLYLGLGVVGAHGGARAAGRAMGRAGRRQLGAHVRLRPARLARRRGRAGSTSTPSPTTTRCAPGCASGRAHRPRAPSAWRPTTWAGCSARGSRAPSTSPATASARVSSG